MKRQKWVGFAAVNGLLLLIVILWSIPTLGLLISSFRVPLIFKPQAGGLFSRIRNGKRCL